MNIRKIIVAVWNIVLFLIVWTPFYNSLIGTKDPVTSIVIVMIIYVIIYWALAKRAKGNEIMPHLGAVIVPDVLMLAEAGLIGRQMPEILPMIEAMLGQLCGTALIFIIAVQYWNKNEKPSNTFLVYGRAVSDDAAKAFAKRLLEKYSKKFKFTCIGNEDSEARVLIEQIKANDVIILYNVSPETRGDFLKICCEMKKKYYFTSSIEDMISQGSVYTQFGDNMLLEYEYRNDTDKSYTAKRLLDMLFSAIFMVILSPVIFIVATCVQAEDKGAIIKKQSCCTKDARVFTRYTFRITSEAEGQTNSLTKVGKFIKRTGLYALPQLLNVFKGEMSFVGPQPESPEITKYNTQRMSEYSYRLWCVPGMTGYSQLYSQKGTPVIDKIKMDIMYVENHTLGMDFKIILLSLLKIALKQPI